MYNDLRESRYHILLILYNRIEIAIYTFAYSYFVNTRLSVKIYIMFCNDNIDWVICIESETKIYCYANKAYKASL